MARPDALGLKTAVCGFSGCCVRGDFEFLARQKIQIGLTVYVITLLIPNPPRLYFARWWGRLFASACLRRQQDKSRGCCVRSNPPKKIQKIHFMCSVARRRLDSHCRASEASNKLGAQPKRQKKSHAELVRPQIRAVCELPTRESAGFAPSAHAGHHRRAVGHREGKRVLSVICPPTPMQTHSSQTAPHGPTPAHATCHMCDLSL